MAFEQVWTTCGWVLQISLPCKITVRLGRCRASQEVSQIDTRLGMTSSSMGKLLAGRHINTLPKPERQFRDLHLAQEFQRRYPTLILLADQALVTIDYLHLRKVKDQYLMDTLRDTRCAKHA